MNLEEKILDMYQDGSDIGYIIVKLNTTHRKINEVLISYREANRLKKSFTDDFKKMIAERDINGVSRRQIAKELEINILTVKKSCEKFGQSFKDKTPSDNEYERIELKKLDMKKCPSCKSKKVNQIDSNVTYCKDCGSEHEFHSEGEDEDNLSHYALKVNWQYID